MGQGGKRFKAGSSNHTTVLDPHAGKARDVDTGLHRDDIARLKHIIGFWAEPGELMDLDTHAVTKRMGKIFCIPALFKHCSGTFLGLRSGYPGAEQSLCSLMGGQNSLVDG